MAARFTGEWSTGDGGGLSDGRNTKIRDGNGDAVVWQPCTVRLGELKPWPGNPRRMSKKQAERLLESWRELGQFQTIAVGPDNEVYDGHQRLVALLRVYGPDYTVQALRSSRPLGDEERRKLTLNANNPVGSWNWDILAGWDEQLLAAGGFDTERLQVWNDDAANLRALLEAEAQVGQPDRPTGGLGAAGDATDYDEAGPEEQADDAGLSAAEVLERRENTMRHYAFDVPYDDGILIDQALKQHGIPAVFLVAAASCYLRGGFT